MSDSPYTFENLQHGELLRVYSKENKDVSMAIGVFNKACSITVFQGGGSKPARLPIPADTAMMMVAVLQKIKANPQQCDFSFGFKTWNPDNKQNVPIGQINVGVNEMMQLYFKVASNDLNGSHTFLVRPSAKVDLSQSGLNERDILGAMTDTVADVLTTARVLAERLTSFKRPQGGGGGFNRGGGNNRGGGGGFGNNNNSGGGSGSTFGGGNAGGGGANYDEMAL